MRLKFIQIFFIVFTGLVAISTHSISGELLHGPIIGQINPASKEGSTIVFYREHEDTTKNVPVIFIKDRIVASLLPGEYVQTRICDSNLKLRIATRGETVTRGQSKRMNISPNSITYIKIIKTKNKTFTSLVVDESQAKKSLQNIQRTSNIINRHIPKVTLGTDSLFVFNSAKLVSSARITLDKLFQDIQMCPSQVKRIKVTGHTDRIGNKEINEELSKKRAQAVAHYLAKKGLNIPMDVEGHGSKEPVTKNHCKGKISPQLIQCLQPDRRVVVEY